MTRLDPEIIRQQIANLYREYPELSEDETLRLDMVEGETDAMGFFRNLVLMRAEALANAGALKELEKTFAARRARMERRAEAAKELAFKLMQIADLPTVRLAEATLSISKNAPAVFISDEALIPEEYIKTERSPKKSEIKDALKAGKDVPGASLANGSPSLSIRMN